MPPDPFRRSYTLDEALNEAFDPTGKTCHLDCGHSFVVEPGWYIGGLGVGAGVWCDFGDCDDYLATVTRIEDPDHAA